MRRVLLFVFLAGSLISLIGCQPKGSGVAIRNGEKVVINFVTTSAGGKYGRRNAHVVWVEDANGKFVKTLDLWAKRRAYNLTEWMAASGRAKGDIDGMTAATQKAYGKYTSVWDMTDKAGKIVPDGKYVIKLELTNGNADENRFNRTSFEIDKNGQSCTQGPISRGGYNDVTIEYVGQAILQ